MSVIKPGDLGVAALASVMGLATLVPLACADIDPLSGVDFVTITHAGNAPWMGDGTPDDVAAGGIDLRIVEDSCH